MVAIACVAGAARADGPARYSAAPLGFEYPNGWKAEPASDVSAELAVRLTPPAGKRPPVSSLLVLVGAKKLSEADLDTEAAGWHAAHVKNRAAWGMKSDGGLPRDVTRLGSRRLVRYRDKVGSALGANEQTLACATISGRLACVIAAADPEVRDDADALIATILSTLSVKKK